MRHEQEIADKFLTFALKVLTFVLDVNAHFIIVSHVTDSKAVSIRSWKFIVK